MLPFTPFTGAEHQDFLFPGGEAAALLVHGFPGTPLEMRPLGEALQAEGWTCRGLLLPGFGSQLETLPARRWSEWQVAVRETLIDLRREHAPLLMVGHSMGAAVALTAAARSVPDGLDGLVLLAPFWRSRSLLWRLLPVLITLFPRVKPFRLMRSEMDDPRLRQLIRDFLPEVDLEDPAIQQAIRDLVIPTRIFDEVRQVGKAACRAAPDVSCPVLVLQGNQDVTVDLRDTRRLCARLPDARLQELNAAHELVFPNSPAYPQVSQAVLAFAREIAGRYPRAKHAIMSV
jgi:carboxylesterase